ncbi:MAG: lipocalin-like domain-containing protein [Anaerolineae bacterium]|nr:MAG: lipocalin-like domain-containing protein [Anaerolineae bacterium]
MRAAIVSLVVATAIVGYFLLPTTTDPLSATYELLEATGPPGFERVRGPQEFSFPQDHGPHPDYQTEWWYYTGNLVSEGGGRFGYQLTIFRRGLTPGDTQRDSDFATNQIYFGHFALTDIGKGEHVALERFERGSAGLAGATGDPFGVRLGDWSIESLNDTGSQVRLSASEAGIGIDLTLAATKPIVAHGERGYSLKGEAEGNASYYLSFTDMQTQGTLEVGDRVIEVSGSSWFDHEWGTNALGPEAVGWDWFGLQLEDGRELMLFHIRTKDGGIEKVSGGTLVEPNGDSRWLTADEFEILPITKWKSSATGTIYPSGWEIAVPEAGLELNVEPWIKDQEMRLSFEYWEGAVRVSGTVNGQGYVELTGYSGSMQGLY